MNQRLPAMSALLFRPVIGVDRQPMRHKGDRRSSNPERRRSRSDRRLTAQRRSGIPDRRQLLTYYPGCRRVQVADRRRMNADRRFVKSTRQVIRPSQALPARANIVPKGQLIDIAV